MSWHSGLDDVVSEQVSLADRNWLGVGGTAEFFAQPTDAEQLVTLVGRCRENDLAVRVLGGGSNLLIRDEGVTGVVISLDQGALVENRITANTITSGGGAKLAHLVSTAVGAGRAGLESLVGIPGTVGGALHGNAGNHGGDIGQWTSQATVLTRNGELIQRHREDLVFAHRQSSLDELAIVEAQFALEEEDPAVLSKRMQKNWISTKANQPMSHENTLCLFKDPRGIGAEKILEQAGLKGAAAGGVEVSSRHANFVVAHPGATSDDVFRLTDMLREKVVQTVGVELEYHFEIW